ncbi:MAG: hypothetical protein ABI068_07455 [Ktedonobacterales bacterium]
MFRRSPAGQPSQPGPQAGDFDVYLLIGCASRPDLGTVIAANPLLASPLTDLVVQARLTQRNGAPGFLGVDVSQQQATSLLAELQRLGAHGAVIPSLYRQPRISAQEAASRAQPVLVQQEAQYFPNYQFGPVRVWQDDARWWVIGAVAQKLIDEGHIPGGVVVYVDKLDGRVLSSDEKLRVGGF